MTPISIKDIMTRDVVTVPPTMPVPEVATLLQDKNISGVPVVDDEGHVLGMVSEVDILARRGATAGDIMSRRVIGVSEDTEIDEVARLFITQRIHRVPVMVDGRLVGIVSYSDLLRPEALRQVRGTLDVVQESTLTTGSLDVVQEASEESFPASDSPTWTQPTKTPTSGGSIKDIMTREVVTVPPTMPVREVAALMHEKQITGVPVVDDAGHLLGVVSEVDILTRDGATAGDIMSRRLTCITEESSIDEVARLFINQRIRRVPVVAGGRLVGIISRADLLRPAGEVMPGAAHIPEPTE